MERINKTGAGRSVLVIDLEACCWYGEPKLGMYKEIIEIGVANVDFFTKEITKTKSIIVKPQFSDISKFCTKLTTITPELVEKEGVPFKEACKILRDELWSEKKMWFSWGDYDRIAMEKESAQKKVKYPMSKTHINLGALFAFRYGLKQSPSVSTALKQLGLEFEGQAHRGYVDAFNTARILREMNISQ